MQSLEKGATARFSVVTHNISGAATNADATPTYAVYETLGQAAVASGTMTDCTAQATGWYSLDLDLGAAAYTIGKQYTLVISATVGGTAGKIAFDFEVTIGRARLNNKIEHAVATGVDTVYERDGTTKMREFTPTEASGVITMTPGAPS